jgi:hypothetical protein
MFIATMCIMIQKVIVAYTNLLSYIQKMNNKKNNTIKTKVKQRPIFLCFLASLIWFFNHCYYLDNFSFLVH